MALVKESPLPHVDPVSDEDFGAGRRRYFLRTAALVLVLGIVYTFVQPRVYMSHATVLMSAPTAIDETMLEADVQGVAIQGRVLTGSEITGELSRLFERDFGEDLSALEIRGLLEVAGVPDTNLLELRATSSDAQLLPTLVESWVKVYEDIRSRDIESRKNQTLTRVQGELDGLETRLADARQALADFRAENEIISMERQENAVLSQLEGLNTALNNAVEEEVGAKAYLDTLEAGIAAGEQFVPKAERAALSVLTTELNTLRARISDLLARYTEDYIRKDPTLREIPQRIRELESAVDVALTEGTATELAIAQREWERTRQSVAELETRLADHKSAVAEFNTIYARHEALVEDLARLEELNRETLARQVQIEVRQTEKYPQLSVIEWPLPQATRIGPPYLLLLGASVLGALVLGIFAAWLYSFLNPRTAQPAYVTLSGVHMYPQDGVQALAQQAGAAGLENDSAERIAHQAEEDDPGSDDDSDPRNAS